MDENFDNLSELISTLEQLEKELQQFEPSISKVEDQVARLGESFSGSWLGYHSRVYFPGFVAPPPGYSFDPEWGFVDGYSGRHNSHWQECRDADVLEHILKGTDFNELEEIERLAEIYTNKFSSVRLKSEAVVSALAEKGSTFIKDTLARITASKVHTRDEYIRYLMPKGSQMSRDSRAVAQGNRIPPHIDVIAKVSPLRNSLAQTRSLKDDIESLKIYIASVSVDTNSPSQGELIFIGHGQSSDWRELKDFVSDRLNLPFDEFNRVSVAGVPNILRLQQMMGHAKFAFLVLTAEDETNDGLMQARMNVIHEAGLFQGRLGFERAIILLEEGCEEFSNIHGLGQIRFPRGNISACFEEIRRVVEREGLISV